MSFSIHEYLSPKSFPEQLPVSGQRALEAIDGMMAKAQEVLKSIPAPRRIRYGSDGQQVLDVFQPAGPSASPRPALIYMHGGGWTAGYPYWCATMAPAAHAHGAILISPGYGLAPRRKWPAHRDDVFRVLQWVHENACELGINRERIVLAGNSAGGHLSAMAAVRTDLFASFRLPPRPFVKSFSVSGSMTVHDIARIPGTTGERIYKYFLNNPHDDVEASPLTYANASSLPLHLLYVEGDIDRIKISNHEMYEKLRACGVETSLQVIKGLDHFDTMTLPDDPDHKWWIEVSAALGSTNAAV